MIDLLFHGHSCWEITDEKHRVLIDPFLTGNELAAVGPESLISMVKSLSEACMAAA